MVDNSPEPGGELKLRERIVQAARQYLLILIQLVMSLAAFIAAAVYVRLLQDQPPPSIRIPSEQHLEPEQYFILIANLFVRLFATYFPLIVAIWVGFVFAARANSLMRAAFYEQTSVVPQKDFELIGQAIQRGDP